MKPRTGGGRQPTLGDLFDLARQLRRDADTAESALRHRDREIGRDFEVPEERPISQLLAWLERIRERSDELLGERVDAVHRIGLVVLALAGLFAGWGAAAVVFRYDGTHPVNVIHVLVVFVLAQLLFLILFGVGLLPSGITRWIPGMRTFQQTLALLSPGRLQRMLNRYLPQAYREGAETMLGRGVAHQRLYGAVDRWIVVHSSQTFAVFFNLGALAGALYLVTFSDLAFSWSTTLRLEPSTLQRWTDLLSSPWAAWFAGARPSPELIESTRYFRLQDGSFPAAVSAVGLGGWWPFLVMCMAVYGLLPRLLTWAFSRLRRNAVLRRTFRNLPGVQGLLSRLNSELVETQSDDPDRGAAADASGPQVPDPVVGIDGEADVIDWAEAVVDAELAKRWLSTETGLRLISWRPAGGGRPPLEDQEVIEAVSASAERVAVILLVRSWEPPVAEFSDFLGELRSAGSTTRMLLVAPVGRDSAGGPARPPQEQFEIWRRFLGRLGDPWVNVLQIGGPS